MAENPYRSPEGMDEGAETALQYRVRRIRDLALAGLFLGIAYGTAAGAAFTAGLYAIACLARLAGAAAAGAGLEGGDAWLVELLPVTFFHAILGAVSGAVLGPLQGILAAYSASGDRGRAVRRGAFGWAVVAAAWCLLVDQAVPLNDPSRWLRYVALVLAPLAAGVGGAVVGSRLVACRG